MSLKSKKVKRSLIAVALAVSLVATLAFRTINQSAFAACSNTSSKGRIEADFVAPASSGSESYTIWTQAKGPANAVLYGGIQTTGGQMVNGSCTSVSASAINTSNFSWVAINPSNKISLTANTAYVLNLSTDTAGVSMSGAKIINNECNPNTDTTGCATQVVTPTNSAPVVTGLTQTSTSLVAPATLNFNVTVSDDSGVSLVQLYRDSTNVGTMTKTAIANQYSLTITGQVEGSYNFTVRATDNGSPALTATSTIYPVVVAKSPTLPPSVLTSGTYEDNASGIVYSTGWARGDNTNANKYLGWDSYTNTAGAKVTITFKGTSVTAYAAKASWHGMYNVTLDGVVKGTIDLYGSARQDQVPFVYSNLTDAQHTLVLTNSGTKNASSTGTYTTLDRVDVASAPVTTTDTTAPSVPVLNSAKGVSTNRIDLSWSASTDNVGGVGLAGYAIYRNGSQVGTSTTTTYSDVNLTTASTYTYTVKAFDKNNNYTAASNQLQGATLSASDTTPPVGPLTLSIYGDKIFWFNSCTSSAPCSVTITWPAATDNSGSINHYDIYNGGTKLNTTPIAGTAFIHRGIVSGGYYQYKVFAYDNAGLASSGSSVLNETVTCGTFLFVPYCAVN